MAAHALDDYYLGITALITVVFQLLFFFVAYTLQFDKVTDLAGGSNFAILAIVTLAMGGYVHVRQLVVTIFMLVWSIRLAGFLFFRILRTGHDDRFNEMRSKFFSFLGFWIFQMIWVWTVSLPVTLLNSPNITQYDQVKFGTGRDIGGIILFAIGFVMEVVSDAQKFAFRNSHDRSAICDGGLFAVSRHPNYFGEIILHFGIYMIAVSPAANGYVKNEAYTALYASIVGPFFITFLLMFLSGMPLSERPKSKDRYEKNNNWPAYKRWLDCTSILIPFPSQLYEKVPTILKRTVLLEFPMYVFDPAKHSASSAPDAEAAHEQSRGDAEDQRQSAEARLV